jgi:hypothetical protein
MNARFLLAVLAISIISARPVAAEPVDSQVVANAQRQMIARVEAEIEVYARKIKIDPSLISYCRSELALRTSQYPANGQIPFGVIYGQIKESEYLDIVINMRERHETWYLKLCLANAKIALKTAAQ